MMDFALKYQTARDRVLRELAPLLWVSWRELRRIGHSSVPLEWKGDLPQCT